MRSRITPKKTSENVVQFPTRQELMLQDLARSGLTKADAEQLRLEAFSAAETIYYTKKIKRPSYKIPYHDIHGKPLDFFRLRLLNDGKAFGPAEQRYWQKPHSLPLPYFPPLAKIKWDKVMQDPTAPLILTEGEKKAAAACKVGLLCIGLGGVWSWRSKKHEVELLPELKQIVWEKREVFLAFDSDLERNTHVLYAARAFAQTLLKRGAKVTQIRIPSGDAGENVGLDDWLLTHKPKKFWSLPRESLANDLNSQLELLSEELTYVEEQHTFYHLPTNKFLTATTLRQHTYANRNVLGFDEKGAPKQVNVFDEWARWPNRRVVKQLTFAPGQPRVLEDGSLNTWPGWGVSPKRGSVKLWTELLDFVLRNAQPEHRKWFEQWIAYPLQHPGTKLYSCCLLWSMQQRVGKSLIGLTLGKIYGQSFSQVSSEDVHSQNNYWVVNKLFVLAEEVTGSDKRQDADRLKHMITRDMVNVNIKYQPQYSLPDYSNYLFTSNHPDSFFLETHDQRSFVHEIEGAPHDRKFYAAYDKWYKSREGIAAVFDHLLSLSLTGFDPQGHAPVTAAKKDMQDLSRSDLDEFASQIRLDPRGVLQLDGQPINRELWTVDELLTVYDPDGSRRTTRVALGKALRRAGFRKHFLKTDQGARNVWCVGLAARDYTGHRCSHAWLLEQYEKERRSEVKKAEQPKKF